MNLNFKKRITAARRALENGGSSSALILSSGIPATKSHDTRYVFRQSSDFYYLTGTQSQDLALLLSTKERRPVLFSKRPDPMKILWDGPNPDSAKAIASRIGADLVVTNSIEQELLKRLKRIDRFYYENRAGSLSWKIARNLSATPPHERGFMPKNLSHTDQILVPMRLHKERAELALMREAAKRTAEAIKSSLLIVQPGRKEYEVAATVEYFFKLHDCDVAFPTIAGTGPSAATLHHEKLTRTLRKGEMLLLDCGAEYRMYAADITRVFPVDGKFTPMQRDLYEIVLDAQKAALAKIKHGVKIYDVYMAAAKVITAGLRDQKVLKGSMSSLIAKQAWKPYFPHGIGHSLGLDVHDVGEIRGNLEARLEEGMVFTVEPGIYFRNPVKKIPACGIRIEDDVVVTKRGCEVLTADMPKKPAEIEALMHEMRDFAHDEPHLHR